MARLVLLVTAPTVRAGLLSWPAWRVLQGADRVLAAAVDDPLLPALDEAGIGWTLLPGAGPGAAGPGAAGPGAAGPGAAGPGAAGASPAVASPAELARLLTAALAGSGGAGSGDTVFLCPHDPPGRPAGVPPGAVALADELGGPSGPAGVAVELLYGSTGLPGSELLTLVSVMDTLRRNCPWDAKQTHESLAPYLIEESYEALDALESGDRQALREELGDVLLQVMFHARVAQERSGETGFDVDDVADGIVTKLVRRHPHVFADVAVSGAEDVKRNWDQIKAAERAAATGAAGSVLDGVPFGQPALALAAQLQRRAERAGVPAELAVADGSGPDGSGADGSGADGSGAGGAGNGLGAELFELVAKARAAGLDPELELRGAARRYQDRVHAWEQAQAAD
jgi:XTP/dITP diphosphohydrolase